MRSLSGRNRSSIESTLEARSTCLRMRRRKGRPIEESLTQMKLCYLERVSLLISEFPVTARTKFFSIIAIWFCTAAKFLVC